MAALARALRPSLFKSHCLNQCSAHDSGPLMLPFPHRTTFCTDKSASPSAVAVFSSKQLERSQRRFVSGGATFLTTGGVKMEPKPASTTAAVSQTLTFLLSMEQTACVNLLAQKRANAVKLPAQTSFSHYVQLQWVSPSLVSSMWVTFSLH